MPAGAGRPWSALLVPGQPVELPRLGGAALRLTLAAIVGAEGESGQDGGAVLSVILPGRRGTGECSFALARIRAAPGAGAHPVAHVRALVGCGKGARLVAVGGSVVVAGRIEAGVLRQAGAPGPAGSAGRGCRAGPEAQDGGGAPGPRRGAPPQAGPHAPAGAGQRRASAAARPGPEGRAAAAAVALPGGPAGLRGPEPRPPLALAVAAHCERRPAGGGGGGRAAGWGGGGAWRPGR
ncbi:unnamed protein product [Prorocentrum cordatum]|uniref:Uncharacterized protein n=1 Tax=Prorocentrum cordatum TaxID=2364126 RepID=A0ABN9PZ51_9DINO|nr:unnamed protein product [Polarella glacialis]